ncbi:HPr family phosphocarrier protein [Erysipelatoclostridium sp. AM42-17]|uniref:HPr family phosphocarrier protein n=1 Tax=Erysipelatoclostridium sp. AM42-17 TaxID=2293102 RepID=UPI000E46C0EB|nr:HPr family phosphocarrier protein [Erysipelatoclostridium sp. AM42-17]RHS94973.1 HPr family phosphocarrier protein [Erysipelatoclostridium sp. AM42-17]
MAKAVTIIVTDPVGLYATPATELVDTMKTFSSDIQLEYESKSVNMKSLMGVLSLGIPCKATIKVEASGDDEEAVIESVIKKMTELSIGKVQS